jgi:bifunctional DNA-binding transcriptional regulator/antitoxin component of YhaV-PrlF toxin-antitoxin module
MILPLIATMDEEGRLLLPAPVREALQIEGPARFRLEITENALILRPVTVIAPEAAKLFETRQLPTTHEGEQGAS